MSRRIRQSTTVDLPIGPFLDSADGNTIENGLSITQPDIRLKKNGAAWAQKATAQTLTHEENGYYEVTLDATDTNTLGHLRLAVHESGALPVWEDFEVVPANIYDSQIAGTDTLEVDVLYAAGTAWGSGGITAGSIAAGALTSTKFASGAFDAVWSVATRLLTAGTNIALAKGTGVTGFNDIAAGAAMTLTSGERDSIADAILDRANAIETGITVRGVLRLTGAVLAGKASGMGTGTGVFRNITDTKNRVTATQDTNGNRSSITTDVT